MINYPTDQLLYWQHTSDLLLKVSIDKYFDDKPLLDHELNAIKIYIIHWIDNSVFELKSAQMNLIEEVMKVTNREELSDALEVVLEYGIDPF